MVDYKVSGWEKWHPQYPCHKFTSRAAICNDSCRNEKTKIVRNTETLTVTRRTSDRDRIKQIMVGTCASIQKILKTSTMTSVLLISFYNLRDFVQQFLPYSKSGRNKHKISLNDFHKLVKQLMMSATIRRSFLENF